MIATLILMITAQPHAADNQAEVARLISELHLEESAMRMDQRSNWRVPKKLIVLGEAPSIADVTPGVQIVSLRKMTDATAADLANADVILGYAGEICQPIVFDRAKQLRWILSLTAGVENCVMQPAIRERDILVTNLRAVGTTAIAEHAIAFATALSRGMHTHVMNMEKTQWDRSDAGRRPMRVLSGKTMLVVGLGGIGVGVAERAHGLAMKVIATRASDRDGPDFVSYVGRPDELLTLAKTADIVVNTAPLTAKTAGIFDAKFFSVLKPTAFFINVARGGSVVTEDLVAALNDGRLAGAGLDVTDPEPLPPDHPLWTARNVIITPHISAASDLAGDEWVVVREQLRRYVAGEKMLSVVDIERQY